MLRASLKLVLRWSVGLRPVIGTPRSISIVGSGRGQGCFKAEACPTKRAPALSSERFASRYQFPDEQGTPPDQFDFLSLESFEKMSQNPKFWLPLPDPDKALSTAYLVLVRMIMYMGRPEVSDEERNKHWEDFEFTPAPPTSEIGRARTCVSICTSVIAHVLSLIPNDSPLHTSHPQVFRTLESLVILHDSFLADRVKDGKGWEVSEDEIEEWREFWNYALAVLTQLGMDLDLAGFGVSDEIPDEAWREAWDVVDSGP